MEKNKTKTYVRVVIMTFVGMETVGVEFVRFIGMVFDTTVVMSFDMMGIKTFDWVIIEDFDRFIINVFDMVIINAFNMVAIEASVKIAFTNYEQYFDVLFIVAEEHIQVVYCFQRVTVTYIFNK